MSGTTPPLPLYALTEWTGALSTSDVINIIIIIIIQELNDDDDELALTPHVHSIFPLFVACSRCCICVN
jgi:hypothetical protein